MCAKAGKDRTGVLASILLSLAGADREFIAFNYSLSRLGIEPARTLLVTALKRTCPPGTTEESPGFKEACSMKPEYILGFLDKLDEVGGVEGYCKQYAGLSDGDLVAIKQKLKT